MKVSYLGPEKTYSNKAAEMLAKNSELVPLISLETVAKSVDLSTLGVMAYYNYLEGLVQECLDLIYENNLKIIGAHRLPIVLSLGLNRDTRRVFSHPKALAQCSEYLGEYYPETKQVPTTSTAAGAKKALEEGGMAIASLDALNDLEIRAENIGNKKHGRTNFTDFYLVAKENGKEYKLDKDYLTMVAITPHTDKQGLLAEILQQIAYHNLNNAKIHSRPALDEVCIDGLEPQMFYVEIMSHQNNLDFKRCIDSLRYKLKPKRKDIEVIRVLGSYEKPCL
jgi:prephenate dehydratase